MLLVDDSEPLRFLTARAVMKAGDVDVEQASSAEEGARRLDELVAQGRDVFVITDNRMPGKSGADFIVEARARHADVALAMITSSEPSRATLELLEAQHAQVYVRPARQSDLESVVATALRVWFSLSGP